MLTHEQTTNMNTCIKRAYYTTKNTIAKATAYTLISVPKNWGVQKDVELTVEQYIEYFDAYAGFMFAVHEPHSLLLLYEWNSETNEPKEIMRDVYRNK